MKLNDNEKSEVMLSGSDIHYLIRGLKAALFGYTYTRADEREWRELIKLLQRAMSERG